MSLLNSKFDILRGYPNGSALTWPFQIKKTGGSYVNIPAGTIVTTELSGTATVVNAATTPDMSSAPSKPMWLVVEGNDDFSGQFVQKCAACKLGSGIIWETDSYAAGTYNPGQAVSVSAGQIKEYAVTNQVIGHVLENRVATKGTLVIEA